MYGENGVQLINFHVRSMLDTIARTQLIKLKKYYFFNHKIEYKFSPRILVEWE